MRSHRACATSPAISLSAGDLVTKLRFLFIVVIALFGFMNVGAVIAFVMDMRERRATLTKLQQPEMGFAELEGGVWTWRCTQEPLARAVAAPAGSALQLASAFGLPFVRLRAALPESAFTGSVGQGLGRRAGLSVGGLEQARDDNVAVMTQLLQALSCCGLSRDRIPPLLPDVAADAPAEGGQPAGEGKQNGTSGRTPGAQPPAQQQFMSFRGVPAAQRSSHTVGGDDGEHVGKSATDATAEQLIGTALVFAFMANAKTLPVVQYAQRFAAAVAHFEGVSIRGIDHGFEALHGMFLVMLSEGNLSSRGDWLKKARLWRFILLQRADGGWEMDAPLAFALQAHPGVRPPPRPKQSKLRAVIGALMGDADDLGDALDDALDEALSEEEDRDDVAAARR